MSEVYDYIKGLEVDGYLNKTSTIDLLDERLALCWLLDKVERALAHERGVPTAYLKKRI